MDSGAGVALGPPMAQEILEIRAELRKLLSIKDDGRLKQIVVTITAHVEPQKVSISFRGTNKFVILIRNRFNKLVTSDRGLDYPGLSKLVQNNYSRSQEIMSTALRHFLISIF